MAIRVSLANTPAAVDAVLRLRHEVLVAEGAMAPTADGRIVTRHDALPTCTHLVAEIARSTVGCLRIDRPSPLPSAADEAFDFVPYVPDPASAAAIAMLCFQPELPSRSEVVRNLWRMAAHVAGAAGMTHLKGSASEDQISTFVDIGFEVLSETAIIDGSGIPVYPLLLDLARTNETIRDFVARQRLGPFEERFDRLFVPAGEVVVERGEEGHEAYLLISGQARADTGDGRSVPLQPGELFGELSLVMAGQRTATVVAQTDLELMALSRDDFHRQLDLSPAAVRVLEVIATRLTNATEPGDFTGDDDQSP